MMKTLLRDETFELTRNTERARRFFEEKLSYIMTPTTLNERLRSETFQIIDIRNTEDFNNGHIPGSMNIPFEKLETMWTKLSKDKINILYCYNLHCHLSTRGALMLSERNLPVMILEGGFDTWKLNNFKIEK